jgi:hypothetical protein
MYSSSRLLPQTTLSHRLNSLEVNPRCRNSWVDEIHKITYSYVGILQHMQESYTMLALIYSWMVLRLIDMPLRRVLHDMRLSWSPRQRVSENARALTLLENEIDDLANNHLALKRGRISGDKVNSQQRTISKHIIAQRSPTLVSQIDEPANGRASQV